MLHRNACSGELAWNNAFWAHAGYRIDLDEHGVGSVRGQNEVGAYKTTKAHSLYQANSGAAQGFGGSLGDAGRGNFFGGTEVLGFKVKKLLFGDDFGDAQYANAFGGDHGAAAKLGSEHALLDDELVVFLPGYVAGLGPLVGRGNARNAIA